ncbi:HRDC domain-containing protein [Flavobacterium tegetincola]|uniref:HRDC domain-containing protein n=1 Tax=Flavobacterium tegetincola TaxID=150172 RepID=UPI0004145197|nr:HRDC domain-containing protein [Flavobacterium tegetincola]
MKVRIFSIRLAANQLTEDENQLNDFLESVDFLKSDVHFVESKDSYWSVLVHYNEKSRLQKSESSADERNSVVEQDLNAKQQAFYETLKVWRTNKAKELKIPSYLVCHNSELLNAILREAKTPTDLRSIKGFGELKVEKYGDEILSILNAN